MNDKPLSSQEKLKRLVDERFGNRRYNWNEPFTGSLSAVYPNLCVVWEETALESPEYGNGLYFGERMQGTEREDFEMCHSTFVSIRTRWKSLLNVPVLEDVPGKPDPQVLQRMIDSELKWEQSWRKLLQLPATSKRQSPIWWRHSRRPVGLQVPL